MNNAVIVGAARTAVGKRNGKLSTVRPDDLLADTLRALVERTKIDPAEVEDVVIGCVDQLGEQGLNIARNAALIAGFPLDVCGTTLDRMCGSGQQAANFAAMGVMSGQYDCVIAGGVENMSRVPMGSNATGPGEGALSPRLQALYNIVPQGISAEMLAEKWGLKREELDKFSGESHEKAGRAIAEGRFKREIAPITLPDGTVFDVDEGVRVPVACPSTGTSWPRSPRPSSPTVWSPRAIRRRSPTVPQRSSSCRRRAPRRSGSRPAPAWWPPRSRGWIRPSC